MLDLTQAALTWVKEPGVRVSGSRDLDWSKVQAPGIIHDPSGGYRLFYTASGPGKPFPHCQGYILSAFSEDGLTFTPDPGIRVAPDPTIEYGNLRLLAPTITSCADGRWRMYYESRGPANIATVIASAVSVDLLQWEVEPGIRLAAYGGVGGPSYITLPDGRGRLICFASIYDEDATDSNKRSSQSVISAITEDGLNFALEPGFRLKDGYSTQEDIGITAADVIVPHTTDTLWTLLYSAWQDLPPGTEAPLHPSNDPDFAKEGHVEDFAAATIVCDLAGYRSRIFSAVSNDGLNWHRQGCVIEGDGYGQDGIDAIHAEDMSVIRLGDGDYRMYYAACDNEGNWCIASARTEHGC